MCVFPKEYVKMAFYAGMNVLLKNLFLPSFDVVGLWKYYIYSNIVYVTTTIKVLAQSNIVSIKYYFLYGQQYPPTQ